MPFYYRLGKIPQKRHTQFRKEDGSLYSEELISTEGFSSLYSLVYHCHPPTLVKEIEETIDVAPIAALPKNLKNRSFLTFKTQPADDFLESRVVMLYNKDVYITCAAPKKSMTDYFYKNADADEVIFIHEGSGVLKTLYGEIPFEYGDYLVIPRGIIFQMHFNDENNRLFITESFSPIRPPKRYLNSFGQFLEHSPYCERDLKLPQNLKTYDEKGDFKVMIKKQDLIYPFIYATHPFDAIGWDGYQYPYGFSIHNYEPIILCVMTLILSLVNQL
jgi:homogentisate 1,2-dioxygenase